MLKKRIIPLLLIKNGNLLYKGSNFNCWRPLGSLINFVKIYNSRQVDELILLDIEATNRGTCISIDIVRQVAEHFNMPLTVGGGITSIHDVHNLFKSGADRICINTAAYNNPDLIKSVSEKFGKQSVVVSIDYKKINNNYYCFKNNCTENTNILVTDWIKKLYELGCGEILLISFDKEGVMKGMDMKFLETYNNETKISIIFGGGVGNINHVYEAIKYKYINAVAIGSLFPFTQYTPNDIKKFCKQNNISVRY